MNRLSISTPKLKTGAYTLAALVLVTGCLQPPVDPNATATVTISPAELRLEPGAQQQFTAMVAGIKDTRVRWTVLPANSGATIDASGLFTAPSKKTSLTVRATLLAKPSTFALAPVTVAPPVPKLVLEVTEATVGVGERFLLQVRFDPPAPDRRLDWEVEEEDGGQVAQFVSGMGAYYLAPAEAGTFHVRVQSPDLPDVVPVRATIRVVEESPTGILRGTVHYAGPETGRIHVSWGEQHSDISFMAALSTSIPAPGSWSLQTLSHRRNASQLWAFMDVDGNGVFSPTVDPSTLVPFRYLGQSEATVDLTLEPPRTSIPERSLFMLQTIPTTEGAIVALEMPNFGDQPDAYVLTWSRTDLPNAPTLGTITFDSGNRHSYAGHVAHVRFPDDEDYTFQVTPRYGAQVGQSMPWHVPVSRWNAHDVEPSASLEGTLSLSGDRPAEGSLLVLFPPGGLFALVAARIPITESEQAWSLEVPAAPGYVLFHWDRDDDGLFDQGEPSSWSSPVLQQPPLIQPGVDRVALRVEARSFEPLVYSRRAIYWTSPEAAEPFTTQFLTLGVFPGDGPRVVAAQLRGGNGLPVPYDLPSYGAGTFIHESAELANSLVTTTFDLALDFEDGSTVVQPLALRVPPVPELPTRGPFEVDSLQPEFRWTLDAAELAEGPVSVDVAVTGPGISWSRTLPGAASMSATLEAGEDEGVLVDGKDYGLSFTVTDVAGNSTELSTIFSVRLP